MSGNPTPSSEERRHFFRTQGVVYLRLDRLKPPKKPQAWDPKTLDRVEIHLLHLKSIIKYDPPPHEAYLRQLIHIMEQMHRHSMEKTKPTNLARKEVTISGSGLEWTSDEPYKVGEKVMLTLSFLEYPFQTVLTEAEIQSTTKVKKEGKAKFRVALSYSNISEADRDMIIKFVNHLQRKQLSQQRGSTEKTA